MFISFPGTDLIILFTLLCLSYAYDIIILIFFFFGFIIIKKKKRKKTFLTQIPRELNADLNLWLSDLLYYIF